MKPIIVGVDGSRASEAALRWSLAMAQCLDCQVRAITVVSGAGWAIAPDVAAWMPADVATLEDEGRARLDRVVHAVVPRGQLWRVERKVAIGSAPWPLIEESSLGLMLVVGSSRRSALARLLDGSTLSVLVRNARCPLVAVPEHVDERSLVGEQPDRAMLMELVAS